MNTLVFFGGFVLLLLSGFRIAQEFERSLVFRLGRFKGTRGPGLFWIIPIIERQQLIDIRTRTVDLERQETITKDSVTIKVNAVLWYKVVDASHAVIRVADFNKAVYQFAVTTLRNIIGQHQLDEQEDAGDHPPGPAAEKGEELLHRRARSG